MKHRWLIEAVVAPLHSGTDLYMLYMDYSPPASHRLLAWLHPENTLTTWNCLRYSPNPVKVPKPHSNTLFTLLYTHWIKIPGSPHDYSSHDAAFLCPMENMGHFILKICFTYLKYSWELPFLLQVCINRRNVPTYSDSLNVRPVMDTGYWTAVVQTLVWNKADLCNCWLYILHDTSSVLTACVDHVTAVSQHTRTLAHTHS